MKPNRFVGVWTAIAAAVVIALALALSAHAQAFQSGFRTLKVPYYDGYIDVALWYHIGKDFLLTGQGIRG